MRFSAILDAMEVASGVKATREGWNGKGMYIALQTPDENSKMTLPYLYMCTVQGDLVPWLASHTDLLRDDWIILEPLTES